MAKSWKLTAVGCYDRIVRCRRRWAVAFCGFLCSKPGGIRILLAPGVFLRLHPLCGLSVWVLLHNASNSGWGVAIRRIPEVIANLFPFLLVLGLPLVLPLGPLEQGQNAIWEWIEIHRDVQMEQGGVGPDAHRAALYDEHLLLYEKYPYLNLFWSSQPPFLPGWIPRFFIYLGC